MSNIIFVIDSTIIPAKLAVLKKLLHRFVIQKFFLKQYDFGIATLGQTVNWHLLLSNNQEEIHSFIEMLDTIPKPPPNINWPMELLQMINGIKDSQIIFVYGRNQTFSLDQRLISNFYKSNPTTTIDILYLTERLSTKEEELLIKKVYHELKIFGREHSKVFELNKNVSRFMMVFTELLSNPSQRRVDLDYNWKLED